MIKITIQSVSGADYFKFKEYPSEFFESKTKSYELYRNKNSNEDGNKILFSARNVNSGEYLFSNVAVEEVEVDGVTYSTYEELSEGLTPILFKKGGGTGSGGTIQSIQSGSNNVTIDNTDIANPKISVRDTFTSDIAVSLPEISAGVPGRVGKYLSGQVIPASGKTAEEVLKLIAVDAIAPTVNLSSPTTIAFNQTSINNVLNFSYVINSLGGSVQSAVLEWRRGNSGSWTTLSNSTSINTFTHSITDTPNNTAVFNYRYTVADNKGGVKTATVNITPQAYSAPSVTIELVEILTRDKGDVKSTITGTVTRNSVNVPISSVQVQYSVDSGAWVNLGSLITLPASGGNYNVSHDDNTLVNSNNIKYRAVVVDAIQTTTSSNVTVNFLHRNVLGYSSNTTLTLAQILDFTNPVLSNSKSRVINNVSAGANQYTYYVYAASAGDLTSIIQDGSAPVIGAFTKLADVTGTNNYGATVTYRVYKSNATSAFTNNTLNFN